MSGNFLYIIKSGDMRYTRGGGSDGGRPGFSLRISLATAYKMAKAATAERLIQEQLTLCKNALEYNKRDRLLYPELYTGYNEQHDLDRIAQWEAARVVPVSLAEGS